MHHLWSNAILAGPLSIFFTKLGAGRVSQVRSLTPNFTIVALKMRAYWCQNRKNWYFFCINVAQKGYIHEAIFIKFGVGKGLPGSHPRAKFNHCHF